jgi:hypothetical protein
MNMIKFKNNQITNETIKTLNFLMEQEISAVAAFRIVRILKELSPIIESKTKAEEMIYKKWVIFDENGIPVPVKDENNEIVPNFVSLKDYNKFSNEMNDLMVYENEINLPKIRFEDLGLDKIKPADILNIEFIFE